MKIRLLPEEVVKKIAAGEVIERPASIVKELVENSIDAGSTKIEIAFEGGGINMIEVSDNGTGMEKDEISQAFKRHATSKLKKVEDLYTIETLGFRGEALPSIAAVCKVSVVSRDSSADDAYALKISDKEINLEIAARASGTTVRAEDIFFSIPVRKKFLKSESTERRNIISVVESLALSRPDIAFLLRSGKKTIMDMTASDPLERFTSVFGKEMSGNAMGIDFENPFIKVTGFISKPDISFVNRNRIYFFVNSRPVSSPVMIHALTRAYEPFIPKGRFPAAMLNVGIKPDLVDVNVHPAKKEVKFVNQHGVHEILMKVVRGELGASPAKIDMTVNEREPVQSETRLRMAGYRGKPMPAGFQNGRKQSDYFEEIDLSKVARFSFTGPKNSSEDIRDMPVGKILPRFQFKNKYVVGEDSEGIVMIDQHTAWERINYEKLKEQFNKNEVKSQGVLIPEVIQLEPSRAELLLQNLDMLQKFGIHMEEFGPSMFRLTAVTTIAGREKESTDIKDMIDNIISLIEESGKQPDPSELNDSIIKMIACRSSVKAGDRMNEEELRLMVALLNKCDVPHRCPHGRPVIMRIRESELDSKFSR
ncbi:MAG: DNA mismatch repair endonuclease MutL [Elusimicrobiota bacterium]